MGVISSWNGFACWVFTLPAKILHMEGPSRDKLADPDLSVSSSIQRHLKTLKSRYFNSKLLKPEEFLWGWASSSAGLLINYPCNVAIKMGRANIHYGSCHWSHSLIVTSISTGQRSPWHVPLIMHEVCPPRGPERVVFPSSTDSFQLVNHSWGYLWETKFSLGKFGILWIWRTAVTFPFLGALWCLLTLATLGDTWKASPSLCQPVKQNQSRDG